jgi:hypothetical protein
MDDPVNIWISPTPAKMKIIDIIQTPNDPFGGRMN